jgi:PPP family 3-phenylpropionic acid transporter
MYKEFIFLSLFYFLFFTLIGDYVIFMPKIYSNFFNPTQIGIIFSMLPIARFITPFLFFYLTINKKTFISAVVISTLASFILLTNNFYLILFAFFLIGASFSVIFPYIETIAIEKLKEKYGKTRVYGSIGFMLFGVIFSYFSKIDYVMLFIILMILINIVSLYFLEDTFIKREKKSINFFKSWKFWIALILLQISFGGFYNFFTIYNLNHHISKEINGWLWAIGVMAEIIVFLIQHNFIQKQKPEFWIKISILFTSIRWLILYLFAGNILLIALSQLIHAFSFAVFHTSALLYLSKNYQNKTLAQQFYAGIGYGFAAFIGSIISGWLYGENLFLYESFIALLGFFIML